MSSAAQDEEKPAYPIGSVDSAMRLLMLLAERDRVRIAEAATELGVARSTAHRLMQMLVYHGFARQEPDSRAYVAGGRLMALGLQLARKSDVRRLARPYMERLATEVAETVHLQARQSDQTVLCLDSVESPRALRIGSRAGIAFPAAVSAGGRAILSTLSERELIELYPSARLPAYAQSPLRLRTELLAKLQVVRERGYAVQENESEPDVSAISAPVRSGDGVASFALTVALPSARMSQGVEMTIGAAVLTQARLFAAAFGL